MTAERERDLAARNVMMVRRRDQCLRAAHFLAHAMLRARNSALRHAFCALIDHGTKWRRHRQLELTVIQERKRSTLEKLRMTSMRALQAAATRDAEARQAEAVLSCRRHVLRRLHLSLIHRSQWRQARAFMHWRHHMLASSTTKVPEAALAISRASSMRSGGILLRLIVSRASLHSTASVWRRWMQFSTNVREARNRRAKRIQAILKLQSGVQLREFAHRWSLWVSFTTQHRQHEVASKVSSTKDLRQYRISPFMGSSHIRIRRRQFCASCRDCSAVDLVKPFCAGNMSMKENGHPY